MTSLVLTIAVLLIAFLLQAGNPWLAGMVAVVPVKILGVAFMSFETGGAAHLSSAIGGMLIGQCLWTMALFAAYFYLEYKL